MRFGHACLFFKVNHKREKTFDNRRFLFQCLIFHGYFSFLFVCQRSKFEHLKDIFGSRAGGFPKV